MKVYSAIISVPVVVKFQALNDDDATLKVDGVMERVAAATPNAIVGEVHLVALDGPKGDEVCVG